MKRIILLIVLFLGGIALHGQCPTEYVFLNGQGQVNEFVAAYASTCPDLPVSLSIGGNVTDVSGFDFITSIQGNLQFSSTSIIENISGFNNLVSVSGSVSFSNLIYDDDTNPNFDNHLELISGFNSLTTIGGDLRIDQTRTITFDGFYNLETIGGTFRVIETRFHSFTGLTQLERIEGDIDFRCTSITEEAVNGFNNFTSLTSIGGDLSVLGGIHCGLRTVRLDFLTNLTTIEGGLLFETASLPSGLTPIETIGGDFSLKGVESFTTLSNITSIGGDIRISTYFQYTNDGTVEANTNVSLNFPNLESLGGSLLISSPHYEKEINIDKINFNNLTHIGGNINISSDLDGGYTFPSDPDELIDIDEGIQIGNVSINSVTHIDGFIHIGYLPRTLSSYSFSMNSLQTMGGNLSFYRIPTVITFESLYAINGNFDLTYVQNGPGNFVNFIPVLHTVGGDVSIAYNFQSLDGLESIQNIGGDLIIGPSPQDCSAICEYIANNTNYVLDNASMPCVASAQTCTINTIEGIIRNDIDYNDCSPTDQPMQNIEVTAYDGENYYTTYTNGNGEYSILVPEGSFEVSTEPINGASGITPMSQNVTFTGSDNFGVVDFCVTFDPVIVDPVDDISLTVAPVYIAVPGFEARYSIILENQGTTTQNGTITFTFSDANLDFTSATITPTTQATNTLTWDYTNLIAGETRSIIAYFDVLPPPTNNIGDILTFSGSAPLASDVNPNDNQDNIFQVVLSSFDPNDKTVVEGEHLLMEDIDKYLHYVIRFQNEGTSPAVNIRIVDFMSDLIDWETFEPVDASHNYSVALVTGEDQKLEFFFNDIYLPDSTTDEPNSHGYIAFRVKPKSTLQIGDIINNRAGIYFDFNAPIITNKTETRIVEDTDGDTIYNYQDNCPDTANTDQEDLDGDGVGDVCDDDIDDDGILNADDNCPLVASDNLNDNDNDGLGDVCDDDDDNDGILDDVDNCINELNPLQEDLDADGIGDACDDDTDGDGILNADDNCPLVASDDLNDNDNDGLGDVCDDDDDDDGVLDIDDTCPFTANADQNDTDNDGLGDICDDDDDDDGILDADDNCPLIANANQADFDGDGLGDFCDDDDDNDGILDIDDDCPYYSGTNTTNGCPFYLPADNLIIETTSETCVNQNNAEINIKAIADYTYEVNLLLNGTAVVIPVNTFTSELTIENLSVGTYELCISIVAENYEQCFTLEIEDPATLNANSLLSRSNEYNLTLIGATTYSIFINGEEHTVIAADESTTVTFTKQLSKPVNTIEVNTEKACQGKFKETVKTVENLDFTIVPNPTNGDIFITSILGDKASSGTLNIYDVSGRVVSTQVVQFPMQNKQIQINSLTAGVYFITLNTENYSNTKKLIKQ